VSRSRRNVCCIGEMSSTARTTGLAVAGQDRVRLVIQAGGGDSTAPDLLAGSGISAIH